ncbi:MAG: TerB family tellurite resistance protein [Deltaproteobacteria bacterium]|nr:TerB family tellurite resistance protein [Deltaproteobacteria bacterium]MBW2395392.1 TerB family tellurite resistance protein [Deltaproteobacteria bacterium]
MSLLRFLGIAGQDEDSGTAETSTVRAIAARLERLDAETSRFLAGFAYVLARAANADLEIAAEEADEMRRVVHELAELGSEEADLVVEIAKSQARLLGGTENYVVTREFRKHSTREQRVKLLACLYAVAAADGTISGEESGEIRAIAEELGFTRAEANGYRSQYREQLSLLRKAAD